MDCRCGQTQLRAHVVISTPVGHALEPADRVVALVCYPCLLRLGARLAPRHDLRHEDCFGLPALLLEKTRLGEERKHEWAQQRVNAAGLADRADAVQRVANRDVEPVLVTALRSPKEDECRKTRSNGLGNLVEANVCPVCLYKNRQYLLVRGPLGGGGASRCTMGSPQLFFKEFIGFLDQ